MSQKHFWLASDAQPTFFKEIKNITQNVSKSMGQLRKFQPILPRSSLLTIYKTLTRNQLNCADVIYDQAYLHETALFMKI